MNREILRLAIPNILSNISVPLLSSFDTALMGQLSGRHIAAVGLGSMAFNFIYWNFGFLRMGSTGLTAQAFGRDDQSATANLLGRAAIVAGVLAALLLVFQYPISELVNWLLNVQPDQAKLIKDYFFVRIWGAPAALGLMVLFGWFFGMQNAFFPLLLTLVINLGNIGLSYYLVVVKGQGIAGAAWGTVFAQYLGVACALGLLAFRYGWIREKINVKALLLRDELLAFIQVNRDIFIRTLCLTLGFTFFYNRANTMPGEAIVAANVILLQLVNWLSYGVDGFAFAAESLVGKYYGAGKQAELKRAINLSFFWGMGLAGLYAVTYLFVGGPILELFLDRSTTEAVYEVAYSYLPLVAVFCLLATPCYIFDGLFVGLTATTAMRQTMLIAFVGYLLTYWLLRDFGNEGLWLSLTAFMVYRAGLQGWWYWKGWVRQ